MNNKENDKHTKTHPLNANPKKLLLPHFWKNLKKKRSSGFTLLELLTVLAIISVLVSLAFLFYKYYVNRAKIITAVAEINMLEKEIHAYTIDNNVPPPADLSAINRNNFLDPWLNPYQYSYPAVKYRLNPAALINPAVGSFDLYSMGADEQTNDDINAGVSQDDIVRANDGGYRGLVERYTGP